MADSFADATRLVRVSDTEHLTTIPEGWQQGRGAFGGLVLALMLEAMLDREEDKSRVPRSFSGDLCGPALAKEARIEAAPLRRGKNQTNSRATLRQEEGVVGQASCVLAAARHVDDIPRFPMHPPTIPPLAEIAIAPIRGAGGPVFTQHYEYRLFGALPFTGSKTADVTGFVREKVPLDKLTYPAILGRLDSFWPGLFTIVTAPRPMATVSFMAEFLCDPATLDPKEPMFYRANASAEAGGYFVEFRELWVGNKPVAFNQQCFAILG